MIVRKLNDITQSYELGKGANYIVDGVNYGLLDSLLLESMVWNGAFAGVYLSSPFRPNQVLVFPPVLLDGDELEFINEHVMGEMRLFARLKAQKELNPDEKRDLSRLSKLVGEV